MAPVQTPGFQDLVFHEVLTKTALNQVPAASRMFAGSWTINPYRGCSHACRYCFARATHRYLDFDTGHDFDTQIVVKTNVVQVLHQELRVRRGEIPLVMLGSNTDPYQRAEGRYRLMPGIYRELAEAHVPFSLLTKGTLIRRDLPQLAQRHRHLAGVIKPLLRAYGLDGIGPRLDPNTGLNVPEGSGGDDVLESIATAVNGRVPPPVSVPLQPDASVSTVLPDI